MSSQFEKSYRVLPSSIFDYRFWNTTFQNIDQRIVSVEEKKASFEDAEKKLLDVGLKRINETIQPAAEKIMRISELGFLVASSKTNAAAITGELMALELIDNEQSALFTPTSFVGIVRRSTADDYAIGSLVSYNKDKRLLLLKIVSVAGDPGPHNDWDIAALAGSVMAMVSSAKKVFKLSSQVESDAKAVEETGARVATSQIIAEKLYSSFTAVWKGALPNPPQNAELGAQYLDISQKPNIVKVLTETGWAPTVTVSVGGQRMQRFSANGQGPYTVDGGFNSGWVIVDRKVMMDGGGVTFDLKKGTFTLSELPPKDKPLYFVGYLTNDSVDTFTKAEILALFEEKFNNPVFSGTISCEEIEATGDIIAHGDLKGFVSQ